MRNYSYDDECEIISFDYKGPGLYGLCARLFPDGGVMISQFTDGSGDESVALDPEEIVWLRSILDTLTTKD